MALKKDLGEKASVDLRQRRLNRKVCPTGTGTKAIKVIKSWTFWLSPGSFSGQVCILDTKFVTYSFSLSLLTR